MKIKLILLVGVLLTVSCTTKQLSKVDDSGNPILQSMNTNAASFLEADLLHSVSIGIYKDGKEYIRHYGELDKGKVNQPTDESIYEIASVSKTFTGLMAAKAVLDQKLNLEDDIRQYLGKAFANLEYDGTPIRIKHLLAHTSRLPRFLPVAINALFDNIDENLPFRINEIEKKYSKENFLRDLGDIELDMAPGLSYEYSSADTELLAHIIEIVYAKEYEEILVEYLASELKMFNTKTHLTDKEKGRLVNGYGETGKLVPHFANTLWGAGGGMKSTVPDLIKYMKFQLDKSNPIVSESHRIIYDHEDVQMGYYWPIESDQEDGTYYGHHGGAYGTQNWFFVIPKHDLGITVITNQSGRETAGQLLQLVNGILDDIR